MKHIKLFEQWQSSLGVIDKTNTDNRIAKLIIDDSPQAILSYEF